MKEKKTAVITFRTNENIKEELSKVAEYNKWSLALLTEQLCKNFLANPAPQQIKIKTKDFIELAKQIEEEKCGGLEINIDLIYDEKQEAYYKQLRINGLECGGLGCIAFDVTPDEMTIDEILDIP